ncbi:hypothetical protein ACHAXT_001578 [Thalassiosira profunda]
MSILTTVRAAFGPRATLYTVLGCTNESLSSAELKRAYRKAALKHHPDRCTNENEAASTLKFQAVSAAYQVLMDEGRRAIYDSTGRIVDDGEGDISDDGDAGPSHSKSRSAPRGASQSQRQWEQFFHSVFDEIISTGTKHATAASSYRDSEEERRDVLHYEMCKGDMKKVVDCVVHGSPGDVVRWTSDIVQPAIKAGEVEDYSKCSGDEKNCNGKFSQSKRNLLEDSSEDEVVVGETRQSNRAALEDSSEDEKVVKKPSSGKRRLAKGNRNDNSLLEDTDDEEEGDKPPQQRRQSSLSASTSASAGMSKKDKMDFRVAKKRKARAQKDMEMAGIIQSKNWSVDSEYTRRRPKKQNMGSISDALLSNIERNYGGKKRKKR